MIDSGETAVTSASGMSVGNSELQLPATGSNPLIDTAAVPPSAPALVIRAVTGHAQVVVCELRRNHIQCGHLGGLEHQQNKQDLRGKH
jgi:hypothetical protein